ncbi:hypothetical protein OH77DRAFT_1424319 [Trametes cingulata]|nr:hypothetical protein OH77DRAFT_1424319 [Trametes cingulata]
MAPAAKEPEAGDKSDPRRPYIILRTLPSLSFTTPTQSINVQFSVHTPARDKFTRMETCPSARPPSVQTFGESHSSPNLSPGRSSPSSVTSKDNSVRAAVRVLEQNYAESRAEMKEIKQRLGSLEGRMESLEQDVKEVLKLLRKEPTPLPQTQRPPWAAVPAFNVLAPSPPLAPQTQLPPPPSPSELSAPTNQSTPDLAEHQRQRQWAQALNPLPTLKRVKSSFLRGQREFDNGMRDLQAVTASLAAAGATSPVPDSPSEPAQPPQPVAGPSGPSSASGSSRRAREKQRELLGRPIQPGPR